MQRQIVLHCELDDVIEGVFCLTLVEAFLRERWLERLQ